MWSINYLPFYNPMFQYYVRNTLILNIILNFFNTFISVINQLDAQVLFYDKFISCLYMFRAHVLIIRRSKLHYTASGIIWYHFAERASLYIYLSN